MGRCPRCGVELAMQDVFLGGRHATVGACPVCGGQWMRESDLERLAEVVEPVLVEWRRLPGEDQQRAVLRCPACEAAPAMTKLYSERDPRVVFDQCPECGGVWLDTNELRAIQQESLLRLLAGFVSRQA
jgi:Zn-finger nucleic acid-binding protein